MPPSHFSLSPSAAGRSFPLKKCHMAWPFIGGVIVRIVMHRLDDCIKALKASRKSAVAHFPSDP